MLLMLSISTLQVPYQKPALSVLCSRYGGREGKPEMRGSAYALELVVLVHLESRLASRVLCAVLHVRLIEMCPETGDCALRKGLLLGLNLQAGQHLFEWKCGELEHELPSEVHEP